MKSNADTIKHYTELIQASEGLFETSKRKFQIGDKAQHNATGLYGIVTGVENQAGLDYQLITVETLNGRTLRGIAQHELGLLDRFPSNVQRQIETAAATFVLPVGDVVTGYGEASLLDELV